MSDSPKNPVKISHFTQPTPRVVVEIMDSFPLGAGSVQVATNDIEGIQEISPARKNPVKPGFKVVTIWLHEEEKPELLEDVARRIKLAIEERVRYLSS